MSGLRSMGAEGGGVRMTRWKAWALRAGQSRMDHSVATYLSNMGEPLVIPHSMFALRGPITVIIDTSFESAEAVKAAYPQDVWRDATEHPRALLEQIDIEPTMVDMVICTHLHYDHCGCNGLFPNARICVQRSELGYALDPDARMMRQEYFSPAGGFRPPYDRKSLELLDGDLDLENGMRLITLPGHTPGSQGVVIETRSGPMCLAGDLVMVKENFTEDLPVGLHTNVDDCYRSLEKVRGLTDCVIPSHDIRIFADDQPVVELV